MEFKDVFAWSYKEFKWIPKSTYKQKIELIANACPIIKHSYQMNPNYAQKVRKYFDKLLDAQFIFPIKTTLWLSPLVIVPNKNGKLWICVDYWKLNSQTKKIHFPYPFWIPYWIHLLDTRCIHSFMVTVDTIKWKWQKKIMRKCHLFLNGEYMPITLCHLDYVML